MSLYVWKLGEIALARIAKKVYAKVRVVKNEDGLFHDEKGISPDKDGCIKVDEILCYYVEICRTGQRLWLPYTSLHLAERSRPFYGSDKVVPNNKPVKPPAMTRKRKIKEDHILPLNVKLPRHKDPDLNTTFDIRHTPLKQCKYENAFKEFVRRGKEMLFDHFYFLLERDIDENKDVLHYLKNVDASTEDKLETVIKNIVTEKEIENYLHQCWRYNFVQKQNSQADGKDGADSMSPESPTKPPTLHTPWCLVCGNGQGRLRSCPACPCSFHLACRREWLISIIHRKNPPKKTPKPAPVVKKILSSTRILCSVGKEEASDLCPSCMWGPTIGYEDVVWHKLGTCSWWPARVLAPGAVPPCLLTRAHNKHHWPLRYYGTLNYSWGEVSRMALFLPSYAGVTHAARDPVLQQAVLDACDDYIAVYLT